MAFGRHSHRLGFRSAFGLAVVGAFAAIATHMADAAQPSIAYNELVRFVSSGGPAPQPGNWGADWQAAAANAQPAAQHHGLFGGIQNTMDMASRMMNAMKLGTPTQYYYMNGWTRTDSLLTQTATIDRPDQHEIITLNLANKTYTIQDTNVQPPTETPPPYQPPQGRPGPPPSPQPGTEKLDITVSASSLGSMTIDGVPTSGFDQDLKMVASQATGSCNNGSFETDMTEYLSSYPDPTEVTTTGPKSSSAGIPPQAMTMNGAKFGCKPTVTTHHSGSVHAPGGRLAMYLQMSLKGGAQTQSGQASGGFGSVIERGGVRMLGPSDASLFSIPPDFTKAQ